MKNKVSLIIGLQLMQKVYTPLHQFHTNMLSVHSDTYLSLINTFLIKGRDKIIQRDLDWFDHLNYSITLNSIGKNIYGIYKKYKSKIDDNFYCALLKLFDIMLKEFKVC